LHIVFVHTPKTAGSSLREALFRARPEALNLCDYGPDSAYTSAMVRAFRYHAGDDLPALRDALLNVEAFTLCGHFKSKVYARTFGPAPLITVLREPVERVISHYRHALRRREFEGSLLEFAVLPQNRDVQARHVGSVPLERWLWIGRQDRLRKDARRLSQMIGARVEPELVNAAPGPGIEISSIERRVIAALNERDGLLFETAADLGGRAGAAAAAPVEARALP
jgi:hypothetical protein